MTDLVYDYITMGVDMIINGVILMGIVVLLKGASILTSYNTNQQANADRINYYKEFSMYDCTENLSCADALSTITYYRYDLDVVIEVGSTIYSNDKHTGDFYEKSPTTNKVITYEELRESLGSTTLFDCMVYENGLDVPSSTHYKGGVITGIKFTAIGG